MTVADFDPYRAESRLRWSNRWFQWRADPGQATFHVLAGVALLAVLSLPIPRVIDDFAPLARDALQRWPGPLVVLTVGVLGLRHAQRLASLREHQAQEWLAALPIAAWMQRRRQRDCLLREGLLHLGVGLTALWAIAATTSAAAIFVACAIVATLVAAPLSQRLARRSPAAAQGVRFAVTGTGRLWRWQQVETGAALCGRSLSFGIWALLLVPMGSGPIGVVAVACAGLLLAMLSTAWTRSLSVLPQAQAWLAPQPMSGAVLMCATWIVPLLTLLAAAGLIGGLLAALGAFGLALMAGLTVIGIGSLHWACVAATRARPQRAALEWLVHITLLVAVLQAAPPLIALCWPLQMAVLLRRAARA